jgi:hypothetical protein
MTLSNLRRLWSFWWFCFAELFGELKSKVAPCILRSLGDFMVTFGTPRDFSLDWLAGWIESSTSLWIPMRFAYVSYVNGHRTNPECSDFDRAHEATPTIQLLTITYVRTLPAAQNTEKKNNPRLGRETFDDQTPQFLNDPNMSRHVGVRKMMWNQDLTDLTLPSTIDSLRDRARQTSSTSSRWGRGKSILKGTQFLAFLASILGG